LIQEGNTRRPDSGRDTGLKVTHQAEKNERREQDPDSLTRSAKKVMAVDEAIEC